ncbi:hypothetical protein I4U23_026180 [Adineta vaga]|nr:hypothetical protein I4U23_026180 [Adineta vaga]
MFWLIVIFILVPQLSITIASFDCYECSQRMILNSPHPLRIPTNCTLKNETSTTCMATLRLDFEQNNGSMILDGLSRDLLNFSDHTTIITHNMQILFDSQKLERTFQIYCFENESCINDLYRIYELSKRHNIIELREKLQSKLYNSSDSTYLSCENNQNETIPCPNGYCQLINNGESDYTRNCIPEGFSILPPGIFIASSMVNDFDTKAPFMYICNQNMCNNMELAEYVQNSLTQYGLLTPFYETPIYVLETTTTTINETTTVKSKGLLMKVSSENIFGIQLIVLLIITFFFGKL